MKFINKGDPVKMRVGKLSEDFYWKTIKRDEVIELSKSMGKNLGFTKVKTTEGQIGSEKVETKQIEAPEVEYTPDDLFFKELVAINGIGKKTAEDIVNWGTKEKLIEVIEGGGSLPFRDDVEEKLRRKYG